VLQLFHRSLQNFTVTFEELRNLRRPENYKANLMKIRKRLMNGMAELLTQVGPTTDEILNLNINCTTKKVEMLFRFVFFIHKKLSEASVNDAMRWFATSKPIA
jgi:hypothetical protein